MLLESVESLNDQMPSFSHQKNHFRTRTRPLTLPGLTTCVRRNSFSYTAEINRNFQRFIADKIYGCVSEKTPINRLDLFHRYSGPFNEHTSYVRFSEFATGGMTHWLGNPVDYFSKYPGLLASKAWLCDCDASFSRKRIWSGNVASVDRKKLEGTSLWNVVEYWLSWWFLYYNISDTTLLNNQWSYHLLHFRTYSLNYRTFIVLIKFCYNFNND